mmetsp:Transcript_10017/g.25942  ORF Transcript_10017/g.25942 Transcript_10017/m.25942 type:complete len:541 (-) Transcript_10017:60-1682(-)
MSTLFPLAYTVLMVVVQCIFWFLLTPADQKDDKDPTKKKFMGGPMVSAFMLLYYFLPTISSTICVAFTCRKFDLGDGDAYYVMAADYRIECGGPADGDPSALTAEFKAIRDYAMVFLFIYPLLTPLLLLLLLYTHKEHIMNRYSRSGDRAEDGVAIHTMDAVYFLIENYHPDFWYFAVVDMYRRLLLTSLTYMFDYFSAYSADEDKKLFSLCLSILAVVLYREIGPFWEVAGDVLTYVCGWTIVLCVISLLLMSNEASLEHQYIISAMLILINIGILFFAGYYQYQEAQEDEWAEGDEDDEEFEDEDGTISTKSGMSAEKSMKSGKMKTIRKKKKGAAISKHMSMARQGSQSFQTARVGMKSSRVAPGGDVEMVEGKPVESAGYAMQSQGYADASQSYGGYAQQSAGYADASQSYGGYAQQSAGYADASQGYAQQSAGYADASQGYAAQSGGYAQQSAGYADASQGYAAQSGGYAQQSAGYADASNSYAAQSGGYASQSQSYAAQSGGYAAQSQSQAQQSYQAYQQNPQLYAEDPEDIDE